MGYVELNGRGRLLQHHAALVLDYRALAAHVPLLNGRLVPTANFALFPSPVLT